MNLGTFTVDVQITPDGKFDVYLEHEGSSGEHYVVDTADRVGELLADDIECITEAYS